MVRKNLNLYIYNYIKRYSKLPKHEPSEKSKYAYYCRKLTTEGKIEKIGYGVWIAKTSSTFTHTTTETIRSHGYRFLVRLPSDNTLWENRNVYLSRSNIQYKEIPQGQIIKIRRHNVYLYNNSIQITFRRNKDYSSKNIDLNNNYAIIEFKKTMSRLSRVMKTNFKIGDNYLMQCHHSAIKNAIAKWHLDRGVNKFTIKDENGEEWLLMDNSFNLMELETIHSKTSTHDMKTIVLPLMNTLKKNPDILGETTTNLKALTKIVQEVTENSKQYIKTAINTEKSINKLIQLSTFQQEQIQAQTNLTSILVNEMTKLVKYINLKTNK